MAGSVITVSQLNLYVRTLLESDSRLAFIRVQGEISNLKVHYSSGHIYFTLKDSGGALRCVMFKSNASRLKIALKDGMKIVCVGRISVYERDGAYQMYAEDIIPAGEGDLMIALEKIKQKLDAEGLFNVDTKKRLPLFPKTVAVITSDTGAAVRDIFNVLARRWPICDVILCPALVQGPEAPKSLISALDSVENHTVADVIIIGRGGGSIEDLWCFNDEALARRIADCNIPVISAVGHETDFTICDFVSDMRAPTPSAAAEIAVPDIEEMRASVAGYEQLLKMRILSVVNLNQARLEKISHSAVFRDPVSCITDTRLIQVKTKYTEMKNLFDKILFEKEKSFALATARIDSLSPLKIMSRGYLAASKDGKSIRSKKELSKGDMIELRLTDGQAVCEIKEVE